MESHDNFAYLLPFIFFSFGCTFLILQRLGSASSLYWGLGYIAAAFGFATPVALQHLPVEAQAILSNAFFFAAFFLYGQALLTRFAAASAVVPRLLFAALLLGLVSYFIQIKPDLRNELIVGDIGCLLLIFIPLARVFSRVERRIDWLLTGMVALVAAETFLRVSALILFTSDGRFVSLDAFLASDYAFVMQVGASVIGFLLALTVLATIMLDVIGEHRRAAERDPMTDLLNRRGFEQAVPDFGGQASPAGVVLLCDIDHFKRVNDNFGHAAGDAVIVGLAEALRKFLPDNALIARFGGEEFVAFVPGATLPKTDEIADALRLSFAARHWRDIGVSGQITASFGLSATARGDHSIHDAIHRADACLYAAKSRGRNQVVSEGQNTSLPVGGTRQLLVISAG